MIFTRRDRAVAWLTLVAFVCALCTMTGCAESREVCTQNEKTGANECHVYEPYGLLDEHNVRNPNVRYEVSWGNVFWAIIFFEAALVPTALVFGWYLWEPVGPQTSDTPKGATS